MSEAPVSGPVDYLLVELPGETLPSDLAGELLRLVDLGIVDLLDIVLISKTGGGDAHVIDLSGGDDAFGGWGVFAGARSGLLGDDDVAEAGAALTDGTTGLLVVYENKWARGFVAAAFGAGGNAVASARIPAQDLLDALDAIEPEG